MSKITHGLTVRQYNENGKRTHHVLWNTWRGMKERCYDPKSIGYINYGGRGVSICAEWLNDSEKFVIWAFKNGWEKGLSIDRINVEDNYSPDNCRFVIPADNNRNQRKRKDNKSGYRGVSWITKDRKWRANINFNRVRVYSKAFSSALEAAKARDQYIINNKLNLPLNFNKS